MMGGIRLIRAEDLPFVFALEQKSFGTPWSMALLEETLNSPLDVTWILEEDGAPCGYLNYRSVAGEGELMRMAVSPDVRGRGLGMRLVQEMLSYAEGRDEAILLEVRAGNRPAVRLYEKAGFTRISLRKDYYENPVEDALIYRKEIVQQAGRN